VVEGRELQRRCSGGQIETVTRLIISVLRLTASTVQLGSSERGSANHDSELIRKYSRLASTTPFGVSYRLSTSRFHGVALMVSSALA
jgi:hypothetical protein